MSRPSPRLAARLDSQLQEMYSEAEATYADFEAAALAVLDSPGSDLWKRWAVRRFWLNEVSIEDGVEGSLPGNWRDTLSDACSVLIESARQELGDHLPEWATETLGVRALDIFQRRTAKRISPRGVVRRLQNISRLGDAGVKL